MLNKEIRSLWGAGRSCTSWMKGHHLEVWWYRSPQHGPSQPEERSHLRWATGEGSRVIWTVTTVKLYINGRKAAGPNGVPGPVLKDCTDQLGFSTSLYILWETSLYQCQSLLTNSTYPSGDVFIWWLFALLTLDLILLYKSHVTVIIRILYKNVQQIIN